MFFLFYLEIFRYPYFGATRAFTWMLGIVLATLLSRTQKRVAGAALAVGVSP
jgi:hypothetical protein